MDDIPVGSLQARTWQSALKARLPKLSICVMLVFVFALILPWLAFAWVTTASREEQLANVGQRLAFQVSAYAEEIVETASQKGVNSGRQPSQVRALGNWLRNMPPMPDVEFTTRPARKNLTPAPPIDLNPAQVYRRDGKIIAEVEIPSLSIVVSASKTEIAALAQWSRSTWLEFALLVLRTMLAVVVGVFLYVQIRWRESAQAELIRTREVAETATRFRSEFLAKMSHEFRTPLNAIIGYSELLLEDLNSSGPGSQRDDIARIHSAGKHLLSLVSDILDLSKMEAGQFEIQKSELEIEMIVRSATELVARQAESAGVNIAIDIAPGIPDIIGDARRLQQAILNLVSNAVKYTPRGGEVRVSAYENDRGLIIKITDTGIGIPTDQIATALQPFRQVDQPGRKMLAGTGLGLPIARDLIGLHGGTLTLSSDVNTGTTATIQLPATRLLEKRRVPDRADAQVPRPSLIT